MTRFPAGKYYIGDLCYVFSDKDWSKLCKSDIWDSEGIIFKKVLIYSGGTAYGDGCYIDQFENMYPVDSGTIGIAPVSILSKKKLKDNFSYHSPVFVDFETEFEAESVNGKFTFGHIEIDTR